MRILKLLIPFIVILALISVFVAHRIPKFFFRPTPTQLPITQPSVTPAPPDIEIIATNLEIPWEIAFLPDEDFLVTERPGNLLEIGRHPQTYPIDGVEAYGEGGLLGLALDPDFPNNHRLYLYLTTRSGDQLTNQVRAYHFENYQLTREYLVIDNLKAAQYHDGGRIKFGPNGYLYVTVGDAQTPSLAQQTASLNGKILRLRSDGSLPEDNPFNNPVYSYGHRNPQGLTWDNQGRLWATEHGRSGVQSGYDELNLIQKGDNYGWPTIQGPETHSGMISPVIQSGPADTWAPSGMVYYQGSIFFAGLRGEALYQYQIDSRQIQLHFHQQYGRLRTVALGPDGFFYLLTSNRDGRGEPQPDDDKIIKVNPAILTSN
jgi:glucose/arabinose dehydrogenase